MTGNRGIRKRWWGLGDKRRRKSREDGEINSILIRKHEAQSMQEWRLGVGTILTVKVPLKQNFLFHKFVVYSTCSLVKLPSLLFGKNAVFTPFLTISACCLPPKTGDNLVMSQGLQTFQVCILAIHFAENEDLRKEPFGTLHISPLVIELYSMSVRHNVFTAVSSEGQE